MSKEPNKPPQPIRNSLIDFSNWEKLNGFECKLCRFPAHRHPTDSVLWGCKNCGYATHSVSVYFDELQKTGWPPRLTINADGLAAMILMRGGGRAGRQDQLDCGAALRQWMNAAVKVAVRAERERMKEIYRGLHSGGCRMLSEAMGKVDRCECFLCQVDRPKKEESKREEKKKE